MNSNSRLFFGFITTTNKCDKTLKKLNTYYLITIKNIKKLLIQVEKNVNIDELKSVGLNITEEHKQGILLIDIYTVI